MGQVDFDFATETQIIEALKQINPNYKISYDSGIADLQDDVIVATV